MTLSENPLETSVTRSSLYLTLSPLKPTLPHPDQKQNDLRVVAACYIIRTLTLGLSLS